MRKLIIPGALALLAVILFASGMTLAMRNSGGPAGLSGNSYPVDLNLQGDPCGLDPAIFGQESHPPHNMKLTVVVDATFISIQGPSPWVKVSSQQFPGPSAQFTAAGSGTVAGVANVRVEFGGTITETTIIGKYSFGSDSLPVGEGGLPPCDDDQNPQTPPQPHPAVYGVKPKVTNTPTPTPCGAVGAICTPTPTATPCVGAAGPCTPTPTPTPADVATATPTPCGVVAVCTPTPTRTPTQSDVSTATPTPCGAVGVICTPTPTPTQPEVHTATPTPCGAVGVICTPTPTPTQPEVHTATPTPCDLVAICTPTPTRTPTPAGVPTATPTPRPTNPPPNGACSKTGQSVLFQGAIWDALWKCTPDPNSFRFDRIDIFVGTATQDPRKLDPQNPPRFQCQSTSQVVIGVFKGDKKNVKPGTNLPHHEVWSANFDGKCQNGVNVYLQTTNPDNHAVIQAVAFTNSSATPTGTATPTRTPTPTRTRTPTPHKSCGDVNDDGHVTSVDALLVLQLTVGLIPHLPNLASADTNRDGRANAVDALLVLQEDAGLLMQPLLCG